MKYLSSILFFYLIFSSCQSELNIEIPRKPSKLVLKSYFSPDSIWSAKITSSSFILDDDDNQLIKNAKVSLFENMTLIDNLFYNEEKELYQSDFLIPETGKKYLIEIEAPGYNRVQSDKSSIPKAININKIILDTTNIIKIGDILYNKMNVEFKDPEEEPNYYMIQIMINTEYTCNFPIVDPSNSQIIGDTTITTTLYNSNILIENISPDNYNDKFWGYRSKIFISDNDFNGRTYNIDIIFYNNFISKPDNCNTNYLRFTVVLNSISKEIFQYETTAELQRNNRDNPFSEPVQVYSNIIGGLGIFGGYSSDTMMIKIK